MGRSFTLTYASRAALGAELTRHASEGAILIPLQEVPTDLALYEPVTLEVVAGDARCAIQAEVLQVLPGTGIAVQFTDLGDASLLAASAETSEAAPLPTVEIAALVRTSPESPLAPARVPATAPTPGQEEGEPPDDAGEDLADAGDDADGDDTSRAAVFDGTPRGSSPVSWSIEKLQSNWDRLNMSEKVRVARYGGRPARMLVLRGMDKSLHNHVLNNPKVSQDEVVQMASMATLDPAVLRRIATSTEWQQNSSVAKALVCNPKLPLPLVSRLIPRVKRDELSRLARTGKVRASVKEAIVKYLDRYR